MSGTTYAPIQKLAKGSAFVFIGTIISLLLGFVSQILLVKATTQNEFGIYSLALTIATICVTISSLGLKEGSARYIAYFKGKDDVENIGAIVFSSIVIALFASVSITLLIILTSEYIATQLFNSIELSTILNLLAITIPFTVLVNVFVSIFRGFNNAKIHVYFNNILRPVTYIILLGVAILLHLQFIQLVYTYIVSILITFLALSLYFINKVPIKIKFDQIKVKSNAKELLVYSMPLLAVSILLTAMSWTDTLMLGYFKTTETVAAYNAVYPIANLLSVVINSIGFLYVPIISQLYARNQIQEVGTINASSTKWCFMITFPIFVLIFLFPEFIINSLYGPRYVEASTVLQILGIGFIMNSFFGVNYYTLMSTGKSRFLMNCTLISAILNICLNIILIPHYGMVGAAAASAISYTVVEIHMTRTLFKFLKIHPFTKKYLRIAVLSVLTLEVFNLMIQFIDQTFHAVIMLYSLFLLAYLILIPSSKSLDTEDIKMLILIQGKLGIKLPR